jgi:Flp pilus assembly protein TadG
MRRLRGNERGAAMLEFAIVFPLQLFVVLGLLQLALAFGANQVVLYSAYSAARAAIPDRGEEDTPMAPEQAAQRAAEVANLAITWAPLSRAADRDEFVADVRAQAVAQADARGYLTTTTNLRDDSTNVWTTQVEHHYEMLLPGIAAFLAGNGGFNFLPWDHAMDTEFQEETPSAGGG